MTSFESRVAGSTLARPDPSKHVNYTLGMVLGVDDFTQEFAYLSGRDQWLARDLLGYGTAEGLRVTVEYGGAGAEVVVSPGSAVTPRGQLVRVTPTQCASVNEWLAQERNRARLELLLKNANSLPLYVVLSHRECATDQVPVPGEPCRSEEESMAASRLADNFRLEFSFDPPDQREEDALRDFVAWLSYLEITDEPGQGGFATLQQFEAEIRRAAHLSPGSDSSSLFDYMYDSPPRSMRVRTGDACEFLRTAFRLWVTELRPLWLGQGQTAGGSLPNEESVLLAELSVPVVRGADRWLVDDPQVRAVTVHEDRRPFLLHLRMVQEWVECGRRVRAPADTVRHETAFGQQPDAGHSEAYSRADHTHGTPKLEGDVTTDYAGRTVVGRINGIEVAPSAATKPSLNQVLMYSANKWVASNIPPQPLGGDVTGTTNANTLSAIKGVPVEINRETAADGQLLVYTVQSVPENDTSTSLRNGALRAAPRWRLTDLRLQGARVGGAAGPAAGQVLTYVKPSPEAEGTWQAAHIPPPPGVTLGGDVTGPSGTNTVSKLSGQPLANFADPAQKPANNQVLTYVVPAGAAEGVWRARPVPVQTPSMAGDVTGTTAASTVRRIFGTDVVNLSVDPNKPRNGQVLTYIIPTGQTVGSWQARDPGAAGAPDLTLEGDVTGSTTGGTTVERIRGTNVADFKQLALRPAPGQVLAFVEDGVNREWRAVDMRGDVTGAPAGNSVNGIRGFGIVAREGDAPFNEGDVLVFRRGTWVPEPPAAAGGTTTTSTAAGSFVSRPAGLPDYSIVAAGIVRGDGTPRAPVYNGLTLRLVETGRITVTFAGYVVPDATFQYVVKAMAVFNAQVPASSNIVLSFEQFLRTAGNGFVLRATSGGQPVAAESLKLLEYMIEVSRFNA